MSTDRFSIPERDFLDMDLACVAVRPVSSGSTRFRVEFLLSLYNASPTGVRLVGRKWTLRDRSGNTRIIEAEGIFDQRPILVPGAVFSYAGSQCFRYAPSGMEVRFFGVDQYHAPFMTPPLVFPDSAMLARRAMP